MNDDDTTTAPRQCSYTVIQELINKTAHPTYRDGTVDKNLHAASASANLVSLPTHLEFQSIDKYSTLADEVLSSPHLTVEHDCSINTPITGLSKHTTEADARWSIERHMVEGITKTLEAYRGRHGNIVEVEAVCENTTKALFEREETKLPEDFKITLRPDMTLTSTLEKDGHKTESTVILEFKKRGSIDGQAFIDAIRRQDAEIERRQQRRRLRDRSPVKRARYATGRYASTEVAGQKDIQTWFDKRSNLGRPAVCFGKHVYEVLKQATAYALAAQARDATVFTYGSGVLINFPDMVLASDPEAQLCAGPGKRCRITILEDSPRFRHTLLGFVSNSALDEANQRPTTS